MTMKVYLCARVAEDARELNDKVARALRARGLTVFVPHEEDLVNPNHKAAPFGKDFAEMLKAEVVVVVGRLGVDCAAEVGWFSAMLTPIVRVAPDADDLSPMLVGLLGSCATFRRDELNRAADAAYAIVQSGGFE
jgi:nucleoside 2-deoxyribosyltransferase